MMPTADSSPPGRGMRPRPRRTAIDWQAVEHDYRAGTLSLRAMADKHGCSHSTIANCASRHGWARDGAVRYAAASPAQRSTWGTSGPE